jgi:hypothetical protein
MLVLDDKVTEQARTALTQLLEERPEFRDGKNRQIQDLIPFLEIEEGSHEWLPHFTNNTRALSTIWHSVIKNGGEGKPSAEVSTVPEPAPTRRNATPRANTKAKPKPTEKSVSPPNSADQLELLTSEQVEGEVVEPVRYELVVQSGPPPTLEERTLQASRALADQFAIVQYHEQMLEQSNRTVEELADALAQARQSQTNAAQAYANSLEDLAKLMATSLGPKAGEFSKLLARVVGNSLPGKK